MFKRIGIIVIIAFCLYGCATTAKQIQLKRMQDLENENITLKEANYQKEQQITKLQELLKEQKNQYQKLKNTSDDLRKNLQQDESKSQQKSQDYLK